MTSMNSKLKDLREKSGFNQSQIAEFLGVTQSFLSKSESGERNFTVDQIEKLSALYGYNSLDLQKEENLTPIKFAFRANEITNNDLIVIANINQIFINSKYMNTLIGKNND